MFIFFYIIQLTYKIYITQYAILWGVESIIRNATTSDTLALPKIVYDNMLIDSLIFLKIIGLFNKCFLTICFFTFDLLIQKIEFNHFSLA